jgi:hypothetical protein
MANQLNIFEQEQKKAYKRRYDKFYVGVKERYEEERKQAEKDKTMTVSIIHGAIPISQMLNLTPRKK